MQKKTPKIEDKLLPKSAGPRGKVGDPLVDEDQPSPTPAAAPLTGGVTIRMKSRRGWRLPRQYANRELQPGECVTLDEATARPIVEAGYAEFVE